MRAIDEIGSRVDAGLREVYHLLSRLIIQLLTPVESHDDILCAVGFHLIYRIHTFIRCRDKVTVVNIEAAVDANLYAILSRDYLRLTDLAVGQAGVIQRCICILNALITEVVEVVVRRRDEIDPALKQDVYIRRGRAEIKRGVPDRRQVSVGEGTFKVCEGILIVGKVLNGICKGISVVIPDLIEIILRILVRREGAVADEGQCEILRGGFRRRGWSRRRSRVRLRTLLHGRRHVVRHVHRRAVLRL